MPCLPTAEPLRGRAPHPGAVCLGVPPSSRCVGACPSLLAPQPLEPLYSSPRGSPESHFSLCSGCNKVPRQLSLKAQLCIMDKGQPGACACSLASVSGRGRSVPSPTEPRSKQGAPLGAGSPGRKLRPLAALPGPHYKSHLSAAITKMLPNTGSLGLLFFFFSLLPFFKYL